MSALSSSHIILTQSQPELRGRRLWTGQFIIIVYYLDIVSTHRSHSNSSCTRTVNTQGGKIRVCAEKMIQV